jgi:hypothetical protein
MATENDFDFSDEETFQMVFPYNAVNYFDEYPNDLMKIKMKDFSDTLKQQGHTCVYVGGYIVGWCGYDICENNDDPKPALD